MAQCFNPPMGSVPTLHLSFHQGTHYNAIRKQADPVDGSPATAYPIGHTLDLSDLQNETHQSGLAQVEQAETDVVKLALTSLGKTDYDLMKSAIGETFGTYEVTMNEIQDLAIVLCDKYEDLSLTMGLDDTIEVQSEQNEESKEIKEDQKVDKKPTLPKMSAKEQADIVAKLKNDRSLMLDSNGKIVNWPQPNRKCNCGSRKPYKRCKCSEEDRYRTNDFVDTYEAEQNVAKAKKGGQTMIAV